MFYLSFFEYIILLPLNLLAPVFNFFLAPFVVTQASENGWLPGWLKWFQTPDNSLDGDSGWKNEHRLWRGDSDVDTNKFKIYVNRVLWLYRNPMYGFDHDVLGAKFSERSQVKTWGDTTIKDGEHAREGYCFSVIQDPTTGKYYWGLLWVKRLFGSSRCLYVDLGWKIKTYSEDPNRLFTNADGDGKVLAQYAFSPRFSKFND